MVKVRFREKGSPLGERESRRPGAGSCPPEWRAGDGEQVPSRDWTWIREGGKNGISILYDMRGVRVGEGSWKRNSLETSGRGDRKTLGRESHKGRTEGEPTDNWFNGHSKLITVGRSRNGFRKVLSLTIKNSGQGQTARAAIFLARLEEESEKKRREKKTLERERILARTSKPESKPITKKNGGASYGKNRDEKGGRCSC